MSVTACEKLDTAYVRMPYAADAKGRLRPAWKSSQARPHLR